MKSVYLDQNVFGHLLGHGSSDWRSDPDVGRILFEHKDDAEVWMSPAHVIVLSQTSDHAKRAQLAHLMLDLCGATRMGSGSDFHLVEMFGNFLNNQVPGAFNPESFFNHYKSEACLKWLGYLGLLAAVEDLQLGTGQKQVRRLKRESLLLHSRIAADPKGQINKIIDAANQIAVTPKPDPLDLGKLSDDEVEEEISARRAQALKVPDADLRAALKLLEENRKAIATVIGVLDIGQALSSVFHLPCGLELTFNTPLLIDNWSTIQNAIGTVPLPIKITAMDPVHASADRNVVVTVLNAAIQGAVGGVKGLTAASIGYYTLFREIDTCIRHRRLPTAGATLDVDHAIAALAHDVFVCHDKILLENVGTFLRTFKVAGHEAVYGRKQLKKALGR